MIKQTQFILTGCNDKTIHGDLTYDDQHTNQEVILFVHGFKGFKDWGAHNLVAKYFAEKGYHYLKFSFSYSGVTADRSNEVTDMNAFAANTISKELVDLNTMINYIAHTYPNSKLTLIGHSRGGGLTIIKGADDPRVNRIVTWSAIADFSSLWKPEQEEEWKNTGKIYVENARTKEKMPLNSTLLEDYEAHKDEYNIEAAAKRIKIPWLIIHGDEDVNVPFPVAVQISKIQPRAILQKIKGANHVYGASHPYTSPAMPEQLQEVCEKTLDFIKD